MSRLRETRCGEDKDAKPNQPGLLPPHDRATVALVHGVALSSSADIVHCLISDDAYRANHTNTNYDSIKTHWLEAVPKGHRQTQGCRQRTVGRRVNVELEAQKTSGLSAGFRVQPIGNATFRAVSALSPRQVADFFQEYPSMATLLLTESENKRFTPSRFITHRSAGGFSVGWFSADGGYACVQNFSALADATTDYLLFSLGKGRWTSPQSS